MNIDRNTPAKYQAGDKVFAKVDPEIPLVVRRYVNRIYYCKFQNQPEKSEIALFEREIVEG